MKHKTPWTGWRAPSVHQRTLLYQKCGQTCFLGPRQKFPICSANTANAATANAATANAATAKANTANATTANAATRSCKVDKKGVWAAYLRARSLSSKKANRRSTKRKRTAPRRNKHGHSQRLTQKQYKKIASRAHKLL